MNDPHTAMLAMPETAGGQMIQQPDTPSEKRDDAAKAYSDTRRYLEQKLEDNQKVLALLRTATSTSLRDVIDTTQEAEDNKNRPKSWSRGLSMRTFDHGKVPDAFSSHQYVGLVWRVVNIVSRSITNRSALNIHLSQAISLTAQVMPRIKLSAELFQTDEMKNYIALLGIEIVSLLEAFLVWYARPTGRVFTVPIPFALSYKSAAKQIRTFVQTLHDIMSLLSLHGPLLSSPNQSSWSRQRRARSRSFSRSLVSLSFSLLRPGSPLDDFSV